MSQYLRLHRVDDPPEVSILVNMEQMVGAIPADAGGATLWPIAGPDDHIEVTETLEQIARLLGLPWYPDQAVLTTTTASPAPAP